MLAEVTNKIEQYQTLNDVHQYQLILDASTVFIKALPLGVTNQGELSIGIELFRKLTSVTMITSLHQYEYDYDLQNDILYKKLAVFRLCIPDSHKGLRGLTEMLVGMQENEMDEIIKTL
jgi:hypothetical protein